MLFVPDCIRSNLRGSKFGKKGGGDMPPDPLVAMHAYAHYYSPATILLPQLKIQYETLRSLASIMQEPNEKLSLWVSVTHQVKLKGRQVMEL